MTEYHLLNEQVDGFNFIIIVRTAVQMMARGVNDTHAFFLSLSHAHTHLLRQLHILVAKADVLRLEDLSVGCFAADDDIQLVHRLHHSPEGVVRIG